MLHPGNAPTCARTSCLDPLSLNPPQEHPLLPGPSWCVLHPCNTAAVMALAMALGEPSPQMESDGKGGRDIAEGRCTQAHGCAVMACSAGRRGEGSWVTAGQHQLHVFEEPEAAVPDLEELLTGAVAGAAVLDDGNARTTRTEGSARACGAGIEGHQIEGLGGVGAGVAGAAEMEEAGGQGGLLPQISWPGGDVPVCGGDPEVWGSSYMRLWLSLVGPQVGLVDI